MVAKHLKDQLMTFPAAAAGGVEWNTLVTKYNERYSTKLDIAALGHSSALAAATTLLFEDLRLVDGKDENNPKVAIDDAAAMTPRPDACATWPSLYKSLSDIVNKHGEEMVVSVNGSSQPTRAVLVSQLKSLLQKDWHVNFDEGSLSYVSEEGKWVRLKKMGHLLKDLMKWRAMRVACCKHTEVDEALQFQLGLTHSKVRNDLVLYSELFNECSSCASTSSTTDSQAVASDATGRSRSSSNTSRDLRDENEREHAAMLAEIASLRAENARLRNQSLAVEQEKQETLQKDADCKAMCFPVRSRRRSPSPNQWDDPSEPPHYEYLGTSSASTAAPSSFFNSGEGTPMSHMHSAAATPSTMSWVWDGQSGHICSVVPMFYVMGDRGLHDIPNGVVQQTVSMWETRESSKEVPSYFSMGSREC